jgi:hypothetical protein
MSSRRELAGALTALLRVLDTSDSLDAVRVGSVINHARSVAQRAERGLIEPTPWTPFTEHKHHPLSAMQIRAMVQQGHTEAEVHATFAETTKSRLFINSRYQVMLRDDEGHIHLSIKRIDQQTIHDWRDLQRIKDELVGAECEAVELYPAASRVVDTANQYHLWAVRDVNFRFPLGFNQGRITDDADAEAVGAAQRAVA